MNLKQRLNQPEVLLAPGVYDAFSALIAEQAGFEALYLSGASVAYTLLGRSDIGLTTASEVAHTLAHITDRVRVPVIVDADTGFGNALNTQRTVREFERAGAAMIQLEDQTFPKRCGHLDGKGVVPVAEMEGKLRAALDARHSSDTLILARTDALAVEGLEAAIDRAGACIEAGADALFPEAIRDLETYQKFTDAFDVPILANITEFGMTPLFTVEELKSVGVEIVLYPLSAFRAMNKAAELVYETIRKEGTQKNVVDQMQTRDELYQRINYYDYENALDKFLKDGEKK